MNDMTHEDREQSYLEVHGIVDRFNETPTAVQEALEGMKAAIEKSTKKDALKLVESMDEAYINDSLLHLKFLRGEKFNIKKAAQKFVQHFELKMELFGESKLVKDIEQEDLDENDTKALYLGYVQWLPLRDISGRLMWELTQPTPRPEEQGDPASTEDLLKQIMLYYPEAIDTFPLDFATLSQAQNDDDQVQEKVQHGAYGTTAFGDHKMVNKIVNGDPRIVVPEALHDSTVHWYHVILGHCGQDRLIKSLQNHLHFPGLGAKVKAFVETCDECQRYKNNGPGYCHLPPHDDYPAPFEDVALDHDGPWTLDVSEFGKLVFHALTPIMDIASDLLELLIYNAAGSFTAPTFQLALNCNGITGVPITVKNLQSNTIVERSHATIDNMLRSYQTANIPDNVGTAFEVIDTVFASVQRAMRTAVNKSLGASPGAAIVFRRDMLLNVPAIVDLEQASDRRQAVAIGNNVTENKRRRYKNYNIGDEVLILAHKPHKIIMGARATGPFTITTQVHVNGTVTIQRRNNVTELISIRRLKPYNRRL
ncbi:unnamed protein product [Cylindrotheca closterium]|uniref:Integrase zinc-binding domain-containing protein n=1 Tax=Cylindrotheca closterium TaxID=2856 RepID=A0AAD2FRQ4_9STRA|nr:unnamed protein product [Cylindrotheca closterium]